MQLMNWNLSGNDELLVQGFFAAVGPQLQIIQLSQPQQH